MIEIDRLLAQAEAQQTSDIWEVLNKYRREVTYVDDDGYVNIVGRKIDTIRENVSVQGEQYSQYIEFLMDRFYDGVDLAEHTIAIHYEVEGNGGEDAPINVYKNSTQLKFGWLIGPNVAQYAQPIEFCIWARGTLINGNKYVLKTLPQIYTPKRGLVLGGGIPKPDNNWYLQFSLSMDDKVNQSALNASQAASSANEAKISEIVVLQAQQEVSQKSEVVDTQHSEVSAWHQESKQFRDEAEQFRNQAEQFTPDGYSDLVEQVNKNTVAISTIVEKADLGIKETASGEEIYLFDSSNGKPSEFDLYGKAKQNTTTGKNQLKCKSVKSQTINGVTFTVNEDGSIHAKGTASDRVTFFVDTLEAEEINKFNGFKLSGGTGGTIFYIESTDTYTKFATNTGTDVDITIPEGNAERAAIFYRISNGVPVDDMLYPMISLEGGEYEPYTGGIPAPNPDYPQEIAVEGGSYNLLENTATSQTISGVEFTVNEDRSVTCNGTATSNAYFVTVRELLLKSGKYILSGCPIGGTSNSYQLYSDVLSISDKGSGVQFELSNETTIDVRIAIYSGTTVENLTFYPMIRKASVKNNRYMPYRKDSVEVKSTGKNKMVLDQSLNTDSQYFTYSSNTQELISATVNRLSKFIATFKTVLRKGKTYTISINASRGLAINIYSDKIWGNGVGTLGVKDNKAFTFDGESGEYIIGIYADSSSTIGEVISLSNLQLEEGPVATPYEPYKETLSTIPTTDFAGIKVDSNGNYTDSNGQQWIANEIVKYADGSGEKIHRIKKVVFDGSEDEGWQIASTIDSTKKRYITTAIKESIKNTTLSGLQKNVLLCNSFLATTIPSNYNAVGDSIIEYNGIIHCYSDKFSDGILSEWTSYLAENPITLYYELAEPIRSPLTAEEIAEIEKLSTFYPVTNISNDFDCGMKVTYVVDAKTYVDNKIAQIAAAVVNNI